MATSAGYAGLLAMTSLVVIPTTRAR